jgi:hypothetical protein
MESITKFFQSMLLSVSAFLGIADTTPQQPLAPQVPPVAIEEQKQEQKVPLMPATEEEDKAIGSILTELRTTREKNKERALAPEGTVVERRVAPPDAIYVQTKTPGSDLPNGAPIVVQKTTGYQRTVVQPGAGLTETALKQITMRPTPQEGRPRDVEIAKGGTIELSWSLTKDVQCVIQAFRDRNDVQAYDVWLDKVPTKGSRMSDPIYYDQRYRLICASPVTREILTDTIQFRTRSTVKQPPTCTVTPSKKQVVEGEVVTYTISGTNIETFGFGNVRPSTIDHTISFPFTFPQKADLKQPRFIVTVGNGLGTTTCEAYNSVLPKVDVQPNIYY